MNHPIIELKNISYINEEKNILKNINLKIHKHDKLALLGKNGSGKTSLISILNGTLKPTSGQLKIYKRDYSNLNQSQLRTIGTIWQDLRLIEELTVAQNVNCGLLGRKNIFFALGNLLNIVRFNNAQKFMKVCKLSSSIYSRNIKQISGGQKQRVAIARTIAQEPNILFADEPFNNLDPKLINHLKDLLIYGKLNYKIKLPSTILISLHRMDLLNGFNRIIGLKEGRILFDLKKSKINKTKIKEIYN